MAMLIY